MKLDEAALAAIRAMALHFEGDTVSNYTLPKAQNDIHKCCVAIFALLAHVEALEGEKQADCKHEYDQLWQQILRDGLDEYMMGGLEEAMAALAETAP